MRGGECVTAVLLAGGGGFSAGGGQTLTSLPKAFATDAQFAGQLGFGHVFLMFQYKMLEVIL